MPKEEITQESKQREWSSSLQKEKNLREKRREIIDEFRKYMHITHTVLRLASKEQTEALRTPLLTMELKEEVIAQWEQFQKLLPKLLGSARELKKDIDVLMGKTHLWSNAERQNMHIFFTDTTIPFDKKEQHLTYMQEQARRYEALEQERSLLYQEAKECASLSAQKLLTPAQFQELPEYQRRTLLHSTKNLLRKEKIQKKNEEKKQQQETLLQEQENRKRTENDQEQRQEECRERLAVTIGQLPTHLIALYQEATAGGSNAIHKLHLLMNTRIQAHQNGQLTEENEQKRNTKKTLLVADASHTTHATRDTLDVLSQQTKDHDAVFIPKDVSYQTHATIVSHIHPSLLHLTEQCEENVPPTQEVHSNSVAA